MTAEEIKARGYNLDIKNPHTVEDDHGDPAELLAQLTVAEAETARLRDQLKVVLAEALTRKSLSKTRARSGNERASQRTAEPLAESLCRTRHW